MVALAVLGPLLVLLIKGNDSACGAPAGRRGAELPDQHPASTSLISFALIFVLDRLRAAARRSACSGWSAIILGTVRSLDGQDYRYPLSIRLVS